MGVERLVGVQVTDNEAYDLYRKEMYPILQSYGGDFGYDFRISEVLKADNDYPINRVFTIRFKDEETLEKFFSDPAYLKVKEEYFTPSVESVTQIAKYSI